MRSFPLEKEAEQYQEICSSPPGERGGKDMQCPKMNHEALSERFLAAKRQKTS